MKEDYRKWYSPILGREIEMLVCGHWGYPVLLFPTSMGHFNENKDFGLIESVKEFIDSGKIKIYCIGGIDSDSWYAKHLSPAARAYNHNLYDRFLNEELVPAIQQECNVEKIAVGGCSFGGYHALNFGLKHPDKTAYLLSMSGAFDVSSFVDGYHDDNVYFNNPVAFMQHEQGWRFGHLSIVLGTSEWDICLNDNMRMSRILHNIGVDHWFDIRGWQKHDWPLWRQMFPEYISKMNL
jgi:esterase/lipase superfamily enzyme